MTRADSIAVLAATRVYIAARLQEPQPDDPALAGRIESLALLGKALFGSDTAFLADAYIYAGVLARLQGAWSEALSQFGRAVAHIESRSERDEQQAAQAHQYLGELLFQLGRYEEAKREFAAELAARGALQPEGVPVAIALVNLNEARKATQDTTGIAAAYARAQQICARQGAAAAPRAADVLYRDGIWRLERGDCTGAAQALDRAIALLAELELAGRPLAEACLARADVHLAAAEPEAALAAASLAREHFAACGEAVDAEIAASAVAAGRAQRALFRHEEATASFLDALRILAGRATPPDARLSNCLRTLASHYLDLGRYAEAAHYAQRSLELSPHIWGARSSETAIARLAYAATLHGLQLPDSARVHYARARDDLLATVGSASPLLAEPLLRLGTLAREDGDLAQARAGAEQALALLARAHGAEDSRLADCHHELGIVKRLLGDPNGARQELERALQLAELSGTDSELQAAILSSLALLERSLDQESAARARFEAALQIMERVHSPAHPRHALILRNLASLANAQGRYAEARGLYERALASLEAAFGDLHPEVAATRLGLGNALKAMDERAGARQQYAAAIRIHLATLGPEAPALTLDYHNLAALCLEEGRLDSAIIHAEAAERLGRQHFQLIVQGVSEREALHFAAQRVRGTDIILTAAGRSDSPADWERAWDLVVRSRGAVLEELAARHRFSMLNRDPVVAALADTLQMTSNELASLAVRGCAPTEALPAFKTRLAAARLKKEAAERALAARSREYRDRCAQEGVGLDAIIDALPAQAALIAWVRYERLEAASPGEGRRQRGTAAYAAFVVWPGARRVRFVPLCPASELDELVARWRAEASSNPETTGAAAAADHACLAAGEALRRKLWDPVVADGLSAEQVYLVPDGTLCLVNFNALPHPSGGFLVEQAPLLITLSTERGLVAPDAAIAGGAGLLTIGDPDYAALSPAIAAPAERAESRGIPCGQFKALRFGALPGTARETEAVARLWRSSSRDSVFQLVGTAASERCFRNLAQGRRVLHIATHGFFLGGECVPQAMHTGYAEADELTVGSLVAESPLLLSGMALSGANLRASAASSLDDGILTAEEIVGIDLLGVDLAVLSACGTGLGTLEAGEGVMGLRRAFRVAGVRNLLMSLWSVDDAATTTWMQAFFAAAWQGRSQPSQAVREASLAVLRDRRGRGLTDHPFAWGAFITTNG